MSNGNSAFDMKKGRCLESSTLRCSVFWPTCSLPGTFTRPSGAAYIQIASRYSKMRSSLTMSYFQDIDTMPLCNPGRSIPVWWRQRYLQGTRNTQTNANAVSCLRSSSFSNRQAQALYGLHVFDGSSDGLEHKTLCGICSKSSIDIFNFADDHTWTQFKSTRGTS